MEQVDAGRAAEHAHVTAETTDFAAGILARQPFRGYELREILAAGERSAAFKALDKNMDRPVAFKILRPWQGRSGVVEEFFSLAGSIARLRCPGAARGLDAGRGEGDFFLAYEFLPGETLAARLARRTSGRLTEKESLRLIRELALALQSLFDMGHPHGHLKPSNIIIGEGGKPRLTDIGFAWTLAWPDDETAFRADPDFLPPERIAGEFNIDIRGDMYSMGAAWHLSLTGQPVFRGETPEATLRMHLENEAPSVRESDPKLTAATAHLVRWLLEKDRGARPRTPRDFLRKLAAHPLLADEGETAATPAEAGPETDLPDTPAEAAGSRPDPDIAVL